MENPVEDGAGHAGVVTKDLGPVFVGFIGGENAVQFFMPVYRHLSASSLICP